MTQESEQSSTFRTWFQTFGRRFDPDTNPFAVFIDGVLSMLQRTYLAKASTKHNLDEHETAATVESTIVLSCVMSKV